MVKLLAIAGRQPQRYHVPHPQRQVWKQTRKVGHKRQIHQLFARLQSENKRLKQELEQSKLVEDSQFD